MKTSARRLALLLALPLAVLAQDQAQPPKAQAVTTEIEPSILDLLPKPFVKNPMLEMTAFTEMTAFGRTLTPGTPQAPVYFVPQDNGELTRGEPVAGNKPPPREELNALLMKTLAAAGYLPVTEGHKPGLVLVYFWGAHNAMDPEKARDFPELADRFLLERATLVGGKAYRQEVERGLDFGWSLGDRMPKKVFLFNQAADDLFYAVVSAYAYDDLTRNEHRLAWRTTMTVNARGVSMRESLPPLIVTGENYFGRATGEPVAIRRQVRRGTVTLGPLQVIGEDVPAPKPAPAEPPK